MGTQDKLDQILGILGRHQVPHQVRPDGQEVRVLSGSAGVFIRADRFGDSTAVHMTSPIVVDINFDSADVWSTAMVRAGELNSQRTFVKFCVYDGWVAAEIDLLGDNLQGDELMTALGLLASTVDELDDELADELGGATYQASLENDRPPVET